jgi:hypothetical protein
MSANGSEVRPLPHHICIRVPGAQGRHIGQDQGAGAEAAAIGGLFLFAHDRKGAHHVIGFIAVQAVEVEEQRVQPGAAAQPIFRVPGKGRAGMALVGGEAGHVLRGVGQAQHVFADDRLGSPGPETSGEGFGRNEGAALAKLTPYNDGGARRFQPDDRLLAFLNSL